MAEKSTKGTTDARSADEVETQAAQADAEAAVEDEGYDWTTTEPGGVFVHHLFESTLDGLRAHFEHLTGEPADQRLGEDRLREEIAAHEGG